METGRSTKPLWVKRVREGQTLAQRDSLVVEEPLEIRLGMVKGARRIEQSLSVTMRTPGHDFELAAGFLYSEGIISGRGEIQEIISPEGPGPCNTVTVHLTSGVAFDPSKLERHFYTTSSCGVCGKASLEALRVRGLKALVRGRPQITFATVLRLGAKLRRGQDIFDETGGLHAAGLFDVQGEIECLREDVGRHNAVDKVIGAELFAARLPLSDSILMVSGRTSFEIMQKAVAAGIPIVAAVSAPSSLAVELAEQFHVTLLGFVRDDHFNVYAGAERLTTG